MCLTFDPSDGIAYAGPSLADAGPGARYGVGPPSVRLQWRYGGGGVRFRSSRGPVRPHQLHRPKDGPVHMNRHAAVLNIATWAQEYFRKLLTLNTV